MDDCLFCKIVSGEAPSRKFFENEHLIAFSDIDPKAPIHFLVIPKEHIVSVDEITRDNADVVARIFTIIPKLAKKLGMSKGYRIVSNCGKEGGQTVDHLHFHVLSGRQMAWPPG